MAELRAAVGKRRESHYQAVIIGGGVGGATTALALARAGLRVAVVERAATRAWQAGEGLPAQGKPLLQTLGLWEQFRAAGHLPSFVKIAAWGRGGLP